MRNNYILGLVVSFMVLPVVTMAQGAGSPKPNIQTYNTATSSTTVITAPSGYQSNVVSTFDGKEFHTVATSTPLTEQDIQKMQDDMRAQQEAMNNMFRAQQAFFDEQNRMFESIMKGAFPAPQAQPTPKKETLRAPEKSVAPVPSSQDIETTPTSAIASSSPSEQVPERKASFFQRILRFFGL